LDSYLNVIDKGRKTTTVDKMQVLVRSYINDVIAHNLGLVHNRLYVLALQ